MALGAPAPARLSAPHEMAWSLTCGRPISSPKVPRARGPATKRSSTSLLSLSSAPARFRCRRAQPNRIGAQITAVRANPARIGFAGSTGAPAGGDHHGSNSPSSLPPARRFRKLTRHSRRARHVSDQPARTRISPSLSPRSRPHRFAELHENGARPRKAARDGQAAALAHRRLRQISPPCALRASRTGMPCKALGLPHRGSSAHWERQRPADLPRP